MYLNDNPISDKKDDLLGRSPFVNNLARSIVDNKSTDTFCIGIYGKWGSGKTSVINMLKNELGSIYDAEINNENSVLISFNPWNFSCNEHLLKQFFIRLNNELCNTRDEKLAEVGVALNEYSQALDIAKIIPYGGEIFASLGKLALIKVSSKLKNYSLSSIEDISKQKEKVIELLKIQNKKIIVIIDDIDRLSNEEIRLIFKLVNSVANFPNIMYVLSFDKDIVVKALEDVQKGDGNTYLEKIIQIPISLPEVKKERINNVLFIKLEELLKVYKVGSFESSYWEKAFPICIEPYIKNLRSIKRLCNLIAFKLTSIHSEINFVDMVVISIIENFHPEIFQWIKDNEGTLVGDVWTTFYKNKKSQSDWYSHYHGIFSNLLKNGSSSEGDVEQIILSIAYIFPYFGQMIGKNDETRDHNILRKDKRIAHQEKFGLYFSLDADQLKLKSGDLNNAVYYLDESELKCYLLELDRTNKIIYFLEEMKCIIESVEPDRAKILIKILLQTAIKFKNSNTVVFALSPLTKAEHIIESLLERLKQPDRYPLLESVVLSADADCISCFASVLNTLELAFGRLAAKGQERQEYEKLIDISELESLEKMFIQRIKELIKKENILDFKYSLMVTYLIESFDPKFYEEYFNKEYFKDKLNVLKFLELSAAKWTGSISSWQINDSYKKYLTDEKILDAIQQALADKSLWSLTKKARNIVATFYLLKNQAEKTDNEVNQEQAEAILKQWKEQ